MDGNTMSGKKVKNNVKGWTDISSIQFFFVYLKYDNSRFKGNCK